ncbi:MAG: outer membrane protein transport protein [Chitinophagaceae bacterium]|nr:outer membrane protein transport protein [Chitinophagaceae bacterium]
MKKYLYFFILLSCSFSKAQTPDEALRSAWFTQNGSARVVAIGGVMGSLGGDISAANINPAGIGLYKTKELVFNAGLLNNNNNFNYRDTLNNSEKNIFRLSGLGLVLGQGAKYTSSKLKSTAFAISFNQIANYQNNISFKGLNNYSSFSEQYLEELVGDKADTNAALKNYIFGSSLAFRTYLVDTLADNTGKFIGYKSLVPISTGVIQEYNAQTRGAYNELALAFAGNYSDKFYVGGTIAIPIISYKRELEYSEKDATNNTNNNFSSFTYKESFQSSGVGLGLKLGTIYKPAEFIRLGLAFHTPQIISFRDKIRASMTTNTEAYAGTISETSDALNSNNPGERNYTLVTPYRVIASASYVFREVENTKKQRAFLSADIEFVNYKGARFLKTDDGGNLVKDYYETLNNTTKNTYKGNFNFKLGGEIKFDPWMFRAGVAYYGSPYKAEVINADRLVLSGGIGYRHHGMFIDLAYAHNIVNDAQFPYRLNDKANTFAVQSGNVQNIMLTLGFKL